MYNMKIDDLRKTVARVIFRRVVWVEPGGPEVVLGGKSTIFPKKTYNHHITSIILIKMAATKGPKLKIGIF